jgi:hypothetical protein
LAWDSTVIEIASISFDTYAITREVTTKDGKKWWITTVYGPQSNEDKINFLTELTERRLLCPGPWMLLGDFNLILFASEKNNTNLDRGMMSRFRSLCTLLSSRTCTCIVGSILGAMKETPLRLLVLTESWSPLIGTWITLMRCYRLCPPPFRIMCLCTYLSAHRLGLNGGLNLSLPG